MKVTIKTAHDYLSFQVLPTTGIAYSQTAGPNEEIEIEGLALESLKSGPELLTIQDSLGRWWVRRGD